MNSVATKLAKTLQKPLTLKTKTNASRDRPTAMGLYSVEGGRKYLNAAERKRFVDALVILPPKSKAICLVLLWSGCRISEALMLTPTAIDLDSGVVNLETLKRRRRGVVRQIPLPPQVLKELNDVFDLRARQSNPQIALQRLWPLSRSTAWRHVKKVMKAAGITGIHASPKGLRHTFGIAAFQLVPPHLVQRWLGHASLRTTAIYGNVSGVEERVFAERIWCHW